MAVAGWSPASQPLAGCRWVTRGHRLRERARERERWSAAERVVAAQVAGSVRGGGGDSGGARERERRGESVRGQKGRGRAAAPVKPLRSGHLVAFEADESGQRALLVQLCGFCSRLLPLLSDRCFTANRRRWRSGVSRGVLDNLASCHGPVWTIVCVRGTLLRLLSSENGSRPNLAFRRAPVQPRGWRLVFPPTRQARRCGLSARNASEKRESQ